MISHQRQLVTSFLLFWLFLPLHGIISQWSHQVSHPWTWQIKAQQCEICRPFWPCQSWCHAERLLIKSQVWQSLAFSCPPDRFDFLTQTEQRGGQRGANERGERAGEQEREEGQKEKREEWWERVRDTAERERERTEERKHAGGYH